MTQLNNEHDWLYAAVDPETNVLTHTKLEPITSNVIAHAFFAELHEKYDINEAIFSSMDRSL